MCSGPPVAGRCVALVDLRRIGLSYFSVGAPIWRDVHRSLDSYLRHDIANVFTACNINVCEQRVNHGGDDQNPECHSRSYQHSHYTQASRNVVDTPSFSSCDTRSRPPLHDTNLNRNILQTHPRSRNGCLDKVGEVLPNLIGAWRWVEKRYCSLSYSALDGDVGVGVFSCYGRESSERRPRRASKNPRNALGSQRPSIVIATLLSRYRWMAGCQLNLAGVVPFVPLFLSSVQRMRAPVVEENSHNSPAAIGSWY